MPASSPAPPERPRLIFMGTAPLAATSLNALFQQPQYEIAAVVTQPDRPKGRDLKPQPSAVKQAALAAGLSVLQPARARQPDFFHQLQALHPDLIVVAAYGQIVPDSILQLPPWGCINVHASLLPKYRGAAPIQWAILDDEAETGVTIMKMDSGLDTGDVLTQKSTPILPADNASTLHDRLAELGAQLLLETIPPYLAGRIQPRPQSNQGSSYARKINREDGHLQWNASARSLWNRVRAFTPWPGAFVFLPTPSGPPVRLKIWQTEIGPRASAAPGQVVSADRTGIVVNCSEGSLRILELQREGGRRISAADFLAGHLIAPGTTFL